MANKSDVRRDAWMLKGPLASKGYDWWWHSFTAINEKTGEEKPFYIEFFTCNPACAADLPVIVWNNKELKEKGTKPSYLMVNVGFWGKEHAQLHRFFSLKDVEIKKEVPYEIKADDCFCSETKTRGSINITKEDANNHKEWMSDYGSISWDLDIDKKISFNVGYGANSFFRKLNAFEMFWHAEGMKTLYSGTIILNGEKYIVKPELSYGYADKNWGENFTSPWLWLSSCNLTSMVTGKKLDNSVFDIGGGRPKILGLALNRKLLGAFYYEGNNYEFNFSKFWTFTKTEFESEETDNEIIWKVKMTTLKNKMIMNIRCNKNDMLNINYEAPDGTKRHNRLWNGGNGTGIIELYKRKSFFRDTLIDKIEAKNIGCEYGEYC